MEHKLPIAVLGATGSVGQRFVSLLAGHPWFEIAALTASERSTGHAYGEAANWVQSSPLPSGIASLPVLPTEPSEVPGNALVFSALDASVAGDAERAFVDAGHLVVSNARNHRLDRSVPLVVPEVNPQHLSLIDVQRRNGGSNGAIVTNPNCSTIALVMALKPLHDAFGVEAVNVVTLQAVSGAGLPGISSMQILDNVVPLIEGEEEKLEVETRKILGRAQDDAIEPCEITVSAQCNRVPVVDGHTLCVSVRLARPADPVEVRRALDTFAGPEEDTGLPSAPSRPIHYLDSPGAPQARLHRDLDRGMAAVIGRLRPCSVLDYKFVVLSHNTVRGAAGGALLLAETVVNRGYVSGSERL